jgi:hypothetical protein
MSLYSPKIHDKLIPALYRTARDRSIPMTRLVNGYIYRSLLVERLPKEAYERLPCKSDYPVCPQLGLDGRILEHEKEYIQPLHAATHLAVTVDPFSSTEMIQQWYDEALAGVARSLALARMNLRVPTERSPDEFNIQWKYETAVIQMNQIMVDALVHLGALNARNRAQVEPANGYRSA